MGAKRLKAVVVRGSRPPAPVDKDGARSSLRWFREHYDRSKDRFHVLGSSGGVLALEASGILPTRNFRDGSFEHARAISGQTAETILVSTLPAARCRAEAVVPDEASPRGTEAQRRSPPLARGVGDSALARINHLRSTSSTYPTGHRLRHGVLRAASSPGHRRHRPQGNGGGGAMIP
jgi:hypothetical protein